MDVLIINPQPYWVQRIQARLEQAGARVRAVGDWPAAAKIFTDTWPDVLVVEHRILEKDAALILAALREWEWLPLIVPTAFSHLGTDAAQIPPRGEEALQRLEMLVMRLQGAFEPPERQSVRVGKLTMDPARKEVAFDGRQVSLTPNQFRMLLYLALNARRVVEPRELVREVWGYAGSDSEARQLVKTHVRAVRRKMGWTNESNNYLRSMRGFGYILSPPRARSAARRKSHETPEA